MATKKTKITGKKLRINSPRTLPMKSDYRTRIIVHFNENIRLPFKSDAARSIKEFNVGPWIRIEKKFPGIKIEPLFTEIDPEKLKKWIRKAKEMDPAYKEGNFFNYYAVVCPVEFNPEEIIGDFSSWSHVKNAYIKRQNFSPAVNYSDDEYAHEDTVTPSNPYQRYLNDAQEGISSKLVWNTITGSDGFVDGINFIDIEKGWNLNHEDLVAHAPVCHFGTNEEPGNEHGTGVLGIVCAADNAVGCVGIVPNLKSVNVISTQDASGNTNVAQAILQSLNYLGFGDVLLIEATNIEEYNSTPGFDVPVETTDPEYHAIRLATALGIVVIEPGGNGDNNNSPVWFDDFEKNFVKPFLPPTGFVPNDDFRDSGAIIVTAAESLPTDTDGVQSHKKMLWAPYGARVDCYAWGQNISTLGKANNAYVHNFDGTSGAAAIIAGAVLSMQGMVLSEHGYKLSPGQLRAILRDPSYGTQMSRFITTGNWDLEPIYMPDLQKFANHHLNLPPDIYMRDSLTDDGSPHTGFMSWSPDIILKNTPEGNPTAAFGVGSGLENQDSFSDSAITGTDNYLYFRAKNQGGTAATGAKVTVFYTNPSTMITPSSLTLIGEVDFPGPIPVPEELTVSNGLKWHVTDPVGHYCFVAFITCAQDPYFDPKEIVYAGWTWDTFYHFIRNNNNVTWRNFDIVTGTKSAIIPDTVPNPDPQQDPIPQPDPEPVPQPDPEPDPAPGQIPAEQLPRKDWQALDFISPGLPERNEKMSLEVISKLPKKAIVMLRTPLSWKRDVFRGSPYVRTNRKRRMAYAHINPYSKTKIENILFKAKSRTKLRLFVYIPEKLRNKKYYIAVRQMYKGNEAGRVTWGLFPAPKKIAPVKPAKISKEAIKKRK